MKENESLTTFLGKAVIFQEEMTNVIFQDFIYSIMVDLYCSVNFCCTAKLHSHTYIYIYIIFLTLSSYHVLSYVTR